MTDIKAIRPTAQRDPRWKDIKLGKCDDLTIGSHGCLLSVFAMLGDTTPDFVNSEMNKRGLLVDCGNAATFDLAQVLPNFPRYVGTSARYSDSKFPFTEIVKIKNWLASGQPVALEIDMNVSTSQIDQHFVLAVDVAGNDIVALDPWRGEKFALGIGYRSLLQRLLVRAIYYTYAPLPVKPEALLKTTDDKVWKPTVIKKPTHKYWNSALSIRGIVLHGTAGSYAGAVNWLWSAENPSSSANYVISKTGEVTELVSPFGERRAWTHGDIANPDMSIEWIAYCVNRGINANLVSVGIEHEATGDDMRKRTLMPEAQLKASLWVTAQVLKYWELKPSAQTINGHYQINRVNRSSCPGVISIPDYIKSLQEVIR